MTTGIALCCQKSMKKPPALPMSQRGLVVSLLVSHIYAVCASGLWRTFIAGFLGQIVFGNDLHGKFTLYVGFDVLVNDPLLGTIR